MFLMKKLLLLLLLAALIQLTACSFHKSITNDWVRDLDPSSIEVGKTTQFEVLDILGPPAPTSTTDRATKNVSARHFKYSCWETRTCGIVVGYILVLPFSWNDQREVEELVVEFDDNGIVSDLYRVKDDCIWQPLQGEGSREPMTMERMRKRRQK